MAGRGVSDEPAFRAFLDEQRTRAAADSRARARRLRDQAAEETTFTGLLGAAVERGECVTVGLVSGRRREGRPLGLGADYLVLAPRHGAPVYVALRAIVVVEVGRGAFGAGGAAPPTASPRVLADVLARWLGDGPHLTLHFSTADATRRGRLGSVGVDAIELVADGPSPERFVVPIGAIDELVIEPR